MVAERKTHDDAVRSQYHLGDYDFLCLDALCGRFGYRAKVDALRYAIRRQSERDGAGKPGVQLQQAYDAVLTMPGFDLYQGGGDGSRKMLFWLFPEERAALAKVAARHCPNQTAAEAVRFCLRVQAAADRVAPPRPRAPAVPKLNAARLAALPDQERQVVELRHGLRGGKRQTLDQVGKALGGMSRQKVGQIERRAMKQLEAAS